MNKQMLWNYLYNQFRNELYNEIQNRNIRKHYSGNIYRTTTLDDGTDTSYINIPAPMYDIDMYEKKKVIVYTGEGSYAKEIDISGGFSGDHINYIDDSIIYAINNLIDRAINLGLRVVEVEIK